jgi:hypothetical protein
MSRDRWLIKNRRRYFHLYNRAARRRTAFLLQRQFREYMAARRRHRKFLRILRIFDPEYARVS